MHRLVHAQTFGVRPVDVATAQARHGLWVGLCDELDKFGAWQGLDTANQIRQGITNPRDHHRPAFDAAQAVNALLHGAPLHHIFEVKTGWLFNQTFDLNRPRCRFQGVGCARGVGLVHAKLVKVVVRGGIPLRSQFFYGHGTLNLRLRGRQGRQLSRSTALSKCLTLRPAGHANRGCASTPLAQQLPAGGVCLRRSDFAAERVNESIGM